MSEHKNDHDALLERAVSQIAASRPTDEQTARAAERVWASLRADSAEAAAHAAEIDEIRGCDDYQALIPALLQDALPEARRLLVEDHTRECVPCRRALKEAREGRPASAAPPVATPAPPAEAARPAAGWRSPRLWAIAATLILGIGLAQFLIRELLPQGPSAVVHQVDGDLFRIAATSHLPIAPGAEIAEGETIRTGRGAGAVVRLRDGSLVELRQRSELRIDEGRRGTTLELERGSVIVQAADQRPRHLYVATDDCLVSVTGTIFSVNHGTKGSRVAVVEGEVKVDYANRETAVLHPGDVVATRSLLDPVPVEDEIAWSRDFGRYLALLEEYAALRREIRQTVPRPGLRYASRLLDLAPEGTVFYAAVPNLGETLSATYRLVDERVASNPVLAEWWRSRGGEALEPQIDDLVDRLGTFAEFLGEELAVSVQWPAADDFQGPLALAEVVDAAGLQTFLETQIDEIVAEHGGHGDPIRFVDDPFAPQPGAGDHLLVWIHDDLLVASPDPGRLARVAGFVLRGDANPFTDTAFHAAIAELYDDGAEIVVAADLEGLVAQQAARQQDGEALAHLERLGFQNARHLMLEQKHVGEASHHRAVLSFRDERRGLASWLAEPAPMGALEFVSPDAQMVAAFVFKDPVKLLDDLYAIAGPDSLGLLGQFEERHGLSLRDDFAAALGGEFALALDGPLLPTPSWKLILEVYDPARLQWTLEESVAELNVHLAEQGEDPVEIEQEEVGGRIYYSIDARPVAIHYTYVDGYLVAAPNRALLDRAMRFRGSGYAFADSGRFTALLPADGHTNFSGLIFQDLAGIVGAVAEKMAEVELTDEQRQTLDAARKESFLPSLAYLYGGEDAITVAASSQGDLLSMLVMQAMGLQNPAGLESILGQITGGML